MNIEAFQDELQRAKDNELFRQVQRCLCMTLADVQNPRAESHVMLDFCYAECHRRHKEWLYDKAYETVCRHDDICQMLTV